MVEYSTLFRKKPILILKCCMMDGKSTPFLHKLTQWLFSDTDRNVNRILLLGHRSVSLLSSRQTDYFLVREALSPVIHSFEQQS